MPRIDCMACDPASSTAASMPSSSSGDGGRPAAVAYLTALVWAMIAVTWWPTKSCSSRA
ncbi:hypothetical protein SCANM63S_09600 [Streptomyces canarius]